MPSLRLSPAALVIPYLLSKTDDYIPESPCLNFKCPGSLLNTFGELSSSISFIAARLEIYLFGGYKKFWSVSSF